VISKSRLSEAGKDGLRPLVRIMRFPAFPWKSEIRPSCSLTCAIVGPISAS